jgi:hypothetical protein
MADEPEPIAIDTARGRFAARALGRPGDPAVICLHAPSARSAASLASRSLSRSSSRRRPSRITSLAEA